MRILITGATGFIGSAIVAALQADGHEVLGVTRRAGALARRVPVSRWIELDMARATAPEAWRPHLEGVHAVVNCVGVLQDSAGDSTAAAHRDGPAALFAACEAARVRRVIHFSAMGVDRGGLSDFSETKRQGDAALTARDLDWVILRPSVVVGRPAYGGSALFRSLAALPFLPGQEEAGALQVVQLDDVIETVRFFLSPEAPARVALGVAGPERLSFEAVVAAYRRWLGHPPARPAPALFTGLTYRPGDVAGRLGWRPPIRSNARREMVRGAVGDNSEWIRLTGIRPKPLAAALAGPRGGLPAERGLDRALHGPLRLHRGLVAAGGVDPGPAGPAGPGGRGGRRAPAPRLSPLVPDLVRLRLPRPSWAVLGIFWLMIVRPQIEVFP